MERRLIRGNVGPTALVAALVLATVGLTASAAGTGVTKIAPAEGDPDHPFTLIDSGTGRLVDGSLVVLRLNGTDVLVPLDTHKPYNTAQGRVPAVDGGTYTVLVRPPDAPEYQVGPFAVKGPSTVPDPFIVPTSGLIGAAFTVSDPLGRMVVADVIVFSLEGQAPIDGRVVAANFSEDGTTATGTVPATLAPGAYGVTVHDESAANPPLFNAVLFTVT